LKEKAVVTVTCPHDPDFFPVFDEVFRDRARLCYIHGADAGDRERALEESDAVVTTSCAPAELSFREAGLLKRGCLLQLLFAGADNVPFEAVPEDTLIASNAGAFAEPIAEHVLALTLVLVKKIIPRYHALKNGVFDQSGFNGTLRGKVCGILGFGGNGRAVAKVMKSMGMKVAAVNRRGRTEEEVDFIWKNDRLDELLRISDVLVLALPLTKETIGVIGGRELSLMKKDAILVNIARGAVVDQDALYGHLRDNPDFGVAIDTWWSEPSHHGGFLLDHPFMHLPNFVGSPHVADNVPGMMPSATRLALQNVVAFLEGGPVRGLLDRADYMGMGKPE
jgi:glycerate dehydrogenase